MCFARQRVLVYMCLLCVLLVAHMCVLSWVVKPSAHLLPASPDGGGLAPQRCVRTAQFHCGFDKPPPRWSRFAPHLPRGCRHRSRPCVLSCKCQNRLVRFHKNYAGTFIGIVSNLEMNFRIIYVLGYWVSRSSASLSVSPFICPLDVHWAPTCSVMRWS